MKHFCALFLATILFLLPLAAATADATADGGFTPENTWAVVSNLTDAAQRLNLRTSPSENADSIAKLYSGCYVWVIREVESGWVEVEVGTRPAAPLHGYVNMSFLDFAMDTLHPQMPVLTVSNTVGGTGVTLRTATMVDPATSLGVLPNGTQVTVLAVLPGDWYFVQAGGITGYAAKLGFREDLGGYGQVNAAGSLPTDQASVWDGPAGIYPTAPWPLPIDEYAGVIDSPNLVQRVHLRSAPNENAPSLGKYYNGVRLIINGNSTDEWVAVSIGGLEGYVQGKDITIEGLETVASAMPAVMVKEHGSTEGVALRQQPSATSEMLDVCMNGAEVILMGYTNDWAHVIANGQTGFLPVANLR